MNNAQPAVAQNTGSDVSGTSRRVFLAAEGVAVENGPADVLVAPTPARNVTTNITITIKKGLTVQIKIKKTHPDAIAPIYASKGAACFDLHTVDHEPTLVRDVAAFRTGLAFEIPEGKAMLIFPRSGHGFNSDTRLSNCTGVIDSDYRGEVKVKMIRDRAVEPAIEVVATKDGTPGSRVAQALIVDAEQVEFIFDDELSDTERGEGGFGSTDMKGGAA